MHEQTIMRLKHGQHVTIFLQITIVFVTALITPIYLFGQQLPHDNLHPAVSPDGSMIIFDSTRDDDWEIYSMNIDGSNQMRLTNSQGRDAHPFWSPDGSQIAFQSPRDHEQPFQVEIYTMNRDGSDVRRLTHQLGFNGVPAWSPDGSRILFQYSKDLRAGSWDIFIMNRDGSALNQVTVDDANNQVPNWSPDGTKIIFHSDKTGNNQLYTMNPDGLQIQRITNNSFNDQSATWSPDGSRIAFKSDRSGTREIYIMNSNGSQPERLTEGLDAHGLPVWMPDGENIIFQSGKSGNSEIYKMKVDGTSQTRLTFQPEGTINLPEMILTEGIEQVVQFYNRERAKNSETILFQEGSMNRLGYRFLAQKRFEEAVKIFKLVADTFPKSGNAYDSLAEAYMKWGRKELAIRNYRKSLELDPTNNNAVQMLSILDQN